MCDGRSEDGFTPLGDVRQMRKGIAEVLVWRHSDVKVVTDSFTVDEVVASNDLPTQTVGMLKANSTQTLEHPFGRWRQELELVFRQDELPAFMGIRDELVAVTVSHTGVPMMFGITCGLEMVEAATEGDAMRVRLWCLDMSPAMAVTAELPAPMWRLAVRDE